MFFRFKFPQQEFTNICNDHLKKVGISNDRKLGRGGYEYQDRSRKLGIGGEEYEVYNKIKYVVGIREVQEYRNETNIRA